VDDRASRFHCELVAGADGTLTVRDLKSRNGTKVNDQRVIESALVPGDVLTIGGHEFLLESLPDPNEAMARQLTKTSHEASAEARPEPEGVPEGGPQPVRYVEPAWEGARTENWALEFNTLIDQVPPKLSAPSR
jgi:pSer/pThr/pTyr-binding forkhead associated (FHA) protein